MEEGVGFKPTGEAINSSARFQDESLKSLSHPSAYSIRPSLFNA